MGSARLGVDLGGTKMLLLVEERGGATVERVPTGPEFGPPALLEALTRRIDALERPPASIGIAVPGLVGTDQTVLACDVLPRFVGWSARELRGLTDTVWMMNDAEAALVEETRGLRDADAALVMVGTRIGAAFMTAGHILEGARGWAGELGYLPVVRDGEVTTLDRVAPGEALTTRLQIDGRQLRERLDAGDAAVKEAVEEAGGWLGLGLAAVINLLNPQLLVVGGGTTRLPGYLDAALRRAEASALPDLWSACTVREAAAGEETVARGAVRGHAARTRTAGSQPEGNSGAQTG